MPSPTHRRPAARGGSATVELAVVLPFLMLMFLIGVDWARIFYYSLTVTNCARQGAIYASNPDAAARSPYKTVQAAALAEAPNLQPQPTVASSAGVDKSGNSCVSVTVSWQFTSITGITSPINISRTVTMRLVPSSGS